MNETNAINMAPSANSMKMLRAMVGIGILCALMIVLTFQKTLPIIKENRAEALEKAIFRVLPGVVKTQTFALDQNNEFAAVSGELKEGQLVYAGYDENGMLVGIAVEASGQGYADIIRILYGYDPGQQKVIGFYVLESKETPGLGDKIEKDAGFLANFDGLDLSLSEGHSGLKNKVVTVKKGAKDKPWEVEGITGATISSRAIGDIIDKSAAHWAPLIYQNQEDFAINATPSENAQQ